MISTKSSYLMSDQVIKKVNGLKLYSEPLGKTISSNIVSVNIVLLLLILLYDIFMLQLKRYNTLLT